MDVRGYAQAAPFTTADGSTIRELMRAANQSLAEAVLAPGQATQRHFHGDAEELYYLLEGSGEMEVDGDLRRVGPGDAILIPPRAWHQVRADGDSRLRFLCCCAPAYRREDTFF